MESDKVLRLLRNFSSVVDGLSAAESSGSSSMGFRRQSFFNDMPQTEVFNISVGSMGVSQRTEVPLRFSTSSNQKVERGIRVENGWTSEFHTNEVVVKAPPALMDGKNSFWIKVNPDEKYRDLISTYNEFRKALQTQQYNVAYDYIKKCIVMSSDEYGPVAQVTIFFTLVMGLTLHKMGRVSDGSRVIKSVLPKVQTIDHLSEYCVDEDPPIIDILAIKDNLIKLANRSKGLIFEPPSAQHLDIIGVFKVFNPLLDRKKWLTFVLRKEDVVEFIILSTYAKITIRAHEEGGAGKQWMLPLLDTATMCEEYASEYYEGFNRTKMYIQATLSAFHLHTGNVDRAVAMEKHCSNELSEEDGICQFEMTQNLFGVSDSRKLADLRREEKRSGESSGAAHEIPDTKKPGQKAYATGESDKTPVGAESSAAKDPSADEKSATRDSHVLRGTPMHHVTPKDEEPAECKSQYLSGPMSMLDVNGLLTTTRRIMHMGGSEYPAVEQLDYESTYASKRPEHPRADEKEADKETSVSETLRNDETRAGNKCTEQETGSRVDKDPGTCKECGVAATVTEKTSGTQGGDESVCMESFVHTEELKHERANNTVTPYDIEDAGESLGAHDEPRKSTLKPDWFCSNQFTSDPPYKTILVKTNDKKQLQDDEAWYWLKQAVLADAKTTARE